MPELPTIGELFELMPTVTVVLTVVGLGFYVGWRVRGEAVAILKEWLESLKK